VRAAVQFDDCIPGTLARITENTQWNGSVVEILAEPHDETSEALRPHNPWVKIRIKELTSPHVDGMEGKEILWTLKGLELLVTNRPYHIACRLGHKNNSHWNGWCRTCYHELKQYEIPWYQYEDGDKEREKVTPSRGELPYIPVLQCAECDSIVDGEDYLCGDCRGHRA
jgi:hypothetical protein